MSQVFPLDADVLSLVMDHLSEEDRLKAREVSHLFSRAVTKCFKRTLPDTWHPETKRSFCAAPYHFIQRRAESEAGAAWDHSIPGFEVNFGASLAAVPGEDGVYALREGDTFTEVRHRDRVRRDPYRNFSCAAGAREAVTRCGPTVKRAWIDDRNVLRYSYEELRTLDLVADACDEHVGIPSAVWGSLALSAALALLVVKAFHSYWSTYWEGLVASERALWNGVANPNVTVWETIVQASRFTAGVDGDPWLVTSLPDCVKVENLRLGTVVHNFSIAAPSKIALSYHNAVPHLVIATPNELEVRNLMSGELVRKLDFPGTITDLVSHASLPSVLVKSDSYYIYHWDLDLKYSVFGWGRPGALFSNTRGLLEPRYYGNEGPHWIPNHWTRLDHLLANAGREARVARIGLHICFAVGALPGLFVVPYVSQHLWKKVTSARKDFRSRMAYTHA